MINNPLEYERAQEELRDLTARLDRLCASQDPGSAGSPGSPGSPGDKGLTKAGVRKMIARLHEELAVYEGSQELRQPEAR